MLSKITAKRALNSYLNINPSTLKAFPKKIHVNKSDETLKPFIQNHAQSETPNPPPKAHTMA